ncbi:hypothetical protein E2562_039355 [Oryza meyeriana var. granulata]|uniref:Wall-associated receptor kinase galacturonan-binding domain-containing protein n=1 Tax=Oryza meyeriana var. granulata TaxID=110450 RepID=A0A6G1F2G9_9ORYZ|nr:hypothetical protein E2562_039355 [Oryza meyeriana var. granulata]
MAPLLLLLHHTAVVTVPIAMSTATAVAANHQAAQRPIALSGCPDKCGNISIPYPFSTKPGC